MHSKWPEYKIFGFHFLISLGLESWSWAYTVDYEFEGPSTGNGEVIVLKIDRHADKILVNISHEIQEECRVYLLMAEDEMGTVSEFSIDSSPECCFFSEKGST